MPAAPAFLVASLLGLAVASLTVSGSSMVQVEPRATDELLANPGMGWQTFQRFADEDRNLAGLPSASAYFRFYWREVEPADGQIDFARFDGLLARARQGAQKLAFRIMCTGSGEYMDVPGWLKEKGCQGVEFHYGGRRHWVPDFADPVFQEAHFRLIRELGQRYDGHPDMDLLDIGSVGLWGEWHMSSTTAMDTGKPVPLPPVEVRHAIVDAWSAAFPKSSKVVLIGSKEAMARTVPDGLGWRADCLGDMGGFSKTWNHMEDFYLQQLETTGAQEAWRKAPVAFESCWDMRKWKQEDWDIAEIFEYALRCHASYMNNKSAPLPDGTRMEVERFLRRLGYRLVIRTFAHAPQVRAGEDLEGRIGWENTGVAPPYRDDRVAVRLKAVNDKTSAGVVLKTEHSIRGWLPGLRETPFSVKTPESLRAGTYEVAIGVVDPASQVPSVRLGITGRDEDGWYPLSRLEVRQ